MSGERAVALLGEGARPFCIVFLTICIGMALFFDPDIAAMGVVATLIGVFIGARSSENHAQIKAEAEVKKAEAKQ